jgi:hypothetical protein
MEFIVWVETRLGGRSLEIQEVAKVERATTGIGPEELGLTLAEGKSVSKQVQERIVQIQMEAISAAGKVGAQRRWDYNHGPISVARPCRDARCSWSAIILQGISFSAITFGLVRAFNESNGIEPSISSSPAACLLVSSLTSSSAHGFTDMCVRGNSHRRIYLRAMQKHTP